MTTGRLDRIASLLLAEKLHAYIPRAAALALLLTLALFSLTAGADGMKFPPRDVELYPNIPSQRALISFRDGVEHLTIESTYDGEGESFGWIVPVPATPTAIEEGSSGAIKSIEQALFPLVGDEEEHRLGLSLLAFAASLVLMLLLFTPSSRGALLLCLELATAAGLLAAHVHYMLMLPYMTLGVGSGFTTQANVEVEMTAVAGDLDVQVLKAASASDLDAWLRQNGFKGLPEGGEAIAASYIKDGWRFCAAKERRADEGVTRTHALRISFPTKQPVYPMRLTALADNDVALRLLVVAEEGMAVPGLERQGVRRFDETTIERQSGETPDPYIGLPAMESRRPKMPPSKDFVGNYRPIGHPQAIREMWDGCVVTHLYGLVSPEAMLEDIRPAAASSAYYIKKYWQPEAARQRMLQYAGIAACIAVVLALLIGYRRGHRQSRRRNRALAALFAGVAVGGTMALVVLLATPTVSAENLQRQYPMAAQTYGVLKAVRDGHSYPYLYHRIFPEGTEGISAEEATARVLEYLEVETGEKPYDYQLYRIEGGLTLRLYDGAGFPKVLHMTPFDGPFDAMVRFDRAFIPALVLVERGQRDAAQRAMRELQKAAQALYATGAQMMPADPQWKKDFEQVTALSDAAAQAVDEGELGEAQRALEDARTILMVLRRRHGIRYYLDRVVRYQTGLREALAQVPTDPAVPRKETRDAINRLPSPGGRGGIGYVARSHYRFLAEDFDLSGEALDAFDRYQRSLKRGGNAMQGGIKTSFQNGASPRLILPTGSYGFGAPAESYYLSRLQAARRHVALVDALYMVFGYFPAGTQPEAAVADEVQPPIYEQPIWSGGFGGGW